MDQSDSMVYYQILPADVLECRVSLTNEVIKPVVTSFNLSWLRVITWDVRVASVNNSMYACSATESCSNVKFIQLPV